MDVLTIEPEKLRLELSMRPSTAASTGHRRMLSQRSRDRCNATN